VTTLARLNPALRRMTMEDGLLLRIEADAGNVAAVEALFRKYGIPDAAQAAVDFCKARRGE
jgi:hypothetical protein